jgi:putative two-component system response regulator
MGVRGKQYVMTFILYLGCGVGCVIIRRKESVFVEKKKIILAYDDITVLQIGKNALAEHFNMFTVMSGQSLLDMLEEIVPDLILLDISMPEMTGLEVLKKIRENPETADLFVVFLTAHDDSDTVIEAITQGANDYITKPFHPVDLLIKVQGYLQSQARR